MDVDQYDADDAIYFAYLDGDTVVGNVRVNRTMPSSLLADLFPFLIETGEHPRGPTIFEGSRFIVTPRERSSISSRRIKGEMLASVVDYCLGQGGTHFQAVIDASMLSTFVAMSMKTRILGLPHEYGGGVKASGGGRCVAYRWDLDRDLIVDLLDFAKPQRLTAVADQTAAVVH